MIYTPPGRVLKRTPIGPGVDLYYVEVPPRGGEIVPAHYVLEHTRIDESDFLIPGDSTEVLVNTDLGSRQFLVWAQ